MASAKSDKKSYLDLANILLLLSTFAGAVTLQAEFTLPDECNQSRVRSVLAFASQFFLSCPIAIASIYVALQNERQGVVRSGKHKFIQIQFGLVGVIIITGILLLHTAVYYAGAQYLSSAGVALSSIFILITVAYSIEDHVSNTGVESAPSVDSPSTSNNEGDSSSANVASPHSLRQYLGLDASQVKVRRSTRILRLIIVLLVILEYVGFLSLLGLGIVQAHLADPTTCKLL